VRAAVFPPRFSALRGDFISRAMLDHEGGLRPRDDFSSGTMISREPRAAETSPRSTTPARGGEEREKKKKKAASLAARTEIERCTHASEF